MKLRSKNARATSRCRRTSATGKLSTSLATVFVLHLTLAAGTAFAEDVTFKASSDRAQVYLGESFNLTIEVRGSNARQQPDLSNFKDCRIDYLGDIDRSRRSITVTNGRVSQESYTGRSFTYRITPEKEGAFKAGPITLEHKGKKLTDNGPVLRVLGIEEQDNVIISVESSRESVLVDEPFEIVLRVAIRRLQGQYAHYDPLDPQRPPTLQVPYIEKNFPGIQSPDIREMLQSRLVQHPSRAGFGINEFKLRDRWDFALFDRMKDQKKAKFGLDRREVMIKGKPYYEYSLKMKYTPREETSCTFGPVIFKGDIINSVDISGNGTGKSIFAVGSACTVRVVPPPEDGRPDSYIGAIGTNMTAELELDAQTCNLGDPLKLSLSISGRIRLDNIYPPDLSKQKQITEMFRIYADTLRVDDADGIRTYTYTVRPKQSGTLEVPPVALSYYDTSKRAYDTVMTKAVPLRVREAVKVAENFIIDTDPDRNKDKGSKALPGRILIAPLDVSHAGSVSALTRPTGWQTAILVGSPLFFFITCLLNAASVNLKKTADHRDRKRSLKQAKATIDRGKKLSQKHPREASLSLLAGIKQYIAGYFGVQEGALAPNDINRLMSNTNLPQESISRLVEIYERYFNIAYDSSAFTGDSLEQDIEETQDIIGGLEE
ncbi:hypothetical protein BVX97_05295 [bacterium E08(2017)]|nr:hypothetical protein BVX97_05295 [bacterium E08(2017)]